MSDIVKRFYSPLEKLGLKKHKHSQVELDYLSGFDITEQMDKYVDEADFNINRVSIKFHVSRGLSILFLLLSILSLSYFAWFIPGILFVCSAVTFIVSNHIDTAVFVWKAQKGLCYCTRKELIEKEKEKEIKTMFR